MSSAREAMEVAWLGQRLGRRTLGKEGVAIPLGASKIASHPHQDQSGGAKCRTGSGHQGSAVAGAWKTWRSPTREPERGGRGAGKEAVGALTWAGRGWPGTHHPWRAARGPGWGAAASLGAEGGLPGHILWGQEE